MKQNEFEELQINTALQAAITPVGLEFNCNDFMLGEYFCRVYTVISYPSNPDYGWYSKLTNLPGTIVAINYEPIDNGLLLANMSKNITTQRGIQLSTKDSLERQRAEKSADDQENAMRQMDQNNETMGVWNTTIMVISNDEEDFRERCTRVVSLANTVGCRLRVLANLQKEGYQHISPTYPQNKEINEISRRAFPLSTFVGGFPFAASGFNDGSGYYLGKDSGGGIILLDLWKREKSRTNSNITIIGGTGTGKSTATKHIVASEYAHGTKIIIIDPEGEYKDMCRGEFFDGDWIDVAGGRGGLINPLQVRPAPKDEDDKNTSDNDGIGDLAIHLKTLETFFQLYIPSMDDRLRALLNKTIVELYARYGITWNTDVRGLKNEQFPTIGDLYRLIESKCGKDSNSPYYEDLKTYLESAANGADHGLWNGHTTISPHSSFVVLDTKSLVQMSGSVLAAQYFNVLSWCWEQITRDPTERIMLVADECWTMIDPNVPQSLEFLRNAEKRARKYEGSIVVATQSITDFLDPQIRLYGQAVLDLPSFKLLFGVDGDSLRETKEVFALNEAQYELLAAKQRGIALMKVGSQAVKVKYEFSDERLAIFGKGGGR